MSVTGLTVGIVGLPNSGKSTLFNALLKRQIAQVGEYPYTTIEPNVGVVEVPDKRLEKIANILKISKKVPAAIKFIDIAGLIKGAHKGEGLGNQFLGHIREVDAICHVVRAFENPNVEHIGGRIDPEVDVEVVNDELFKAEIDKPTLYIINVSESDLNKNYDTVFPYIKICAKLEVELSELSGEEQKSYLAELGVDPSTGLSLSQIIKESYKLLDLITFFTIVGGKMVQAWPVKRTTKMVEVAEIVHTDFAKGFIAAEIIDWQKLVDSGSWTSAKENGLIKTVGRDEEIVDGLVVEFKSSI
ncbi:hypothetical protein A3A48_02730 [Candidatus Curtissbacteria bacterium RIFCSPLOWO2_01_FULL_37_9]|uniref:OBG-type G domain-containing protein n=1 Tax=Candidatus Curtissbacteria bacterium RIFCSPLOWO2_01_FULL_37_9 TaxID=1797724 RepID=A0A1F5GV11_9BACT|nr:MAG: hypothetical protein A3A48_02730 [Candidatus Curtissbacteria bacterium RIFCSPLOWO2_01_FULL_37_9]